MELCTLIQEIRQRYPAPKICHTLMPVQLSMSEMISWRRDNYCVAGAVMMAFGYEKSFPITQEVGKFFVSLGINEQSAYSTASKIIETNERGEFDLSWQMVSDLFASLNINLPQQENNYEHRE